MEVKKFRTLTKTIGVGAGYGESTASGENGNGYGNGCGMAFGGGNVVGKGYPNNTRSLTYYAYIKEAEVPKHYEINKSNIIRS